jgi:MerR family transcriptional regulator, copper efflux regulator
MLIKQFCEATGLPRDTVRFYIKRGLLKPAVGSRIGNRYQVFSDADIERARLIRAAQTLGFTLRQIGALATVYEAETATLADKEAIISGQLKLIATQETELRKVREYLEAKLSWIKKGAKGSPPTFSAKNSDREKKKLDKALVATFL